MNLGKLDLDCKTCTKEQKEERGCEHDSRVPKRWQVGDYVFQRCPIKEVGSDFFWYIKAYNFMEKGILPRQGGWLDQSNKFIEAMVFIQGEIQDGQKQITNRPNIKR